MNRIAETLLALYRWLRLHSRKKYRKLYTRISEGQRAPTPSDTAKWASWFNGKKFTTDWNSQHFPNWDRLMCGRSVEQILEIGSWEGRSAIFFLNLFPHASITCVDTFGGGKEHQDSSEYQSALPLIEARFDANMNEFGPRARKFKARSTVALAQLQDEHSAFDLIYIDGSHTRDDVFSDSLLAWPLLKRGGMIVWDDYWWQEQLPDDQRPRMAIDLFLRWHDVRVLHRKMQVFGERMS
jgi:hypothetical protein